MVSDRHSVDCKKTTFSAGLWNLPSQQFLDSTQREFEEITLKALGTFTKAMQDAHLGAFSQVRAHFSNLACENVRLREQENKHILPDHNQPCLNVVNTEQHEAIGPDHPRLQPRPTNPSGECAILDYIEAFTLPNVLVSQACVEPPPLPRPDAWQAVGGCRRVMSGESLEVVDNTAASNGDKIQSVHNQQEESPASTTKRPRKNSVISRPTIATRTTSVSKRARLFPDKTELMAEVQAALFKPEYKVADFYRADGIAQMVARSPVFETLTLCVIFLNSIWIAIDADHNTDPLNPSLGFVVVENLFCAFFFAEILCRFLSFREKRHCLQDFWFVFDFVLVIVAALEVWVLPLVGLLAGVSVANLTGRSSGTLRLLRIARLARTARMAHLLHSVPELVTMFKGMRTAARAVACTILLLAIIIYLFALAFRQLTAESDLGEAYFRSVPKSMATLLLKGVLPDVGDIMFEISDAHVIFGIVGVCFVLLTGLVVLNMLAGVLVNVVLITAELEKEEADAIFVKNSLPVIMHLGDSDGDQKISKSEFDELLKNPKAASLLAQVNIDVMSLVELSDFIFADTQEDLNYEDFFRLFLKFRGSNTATTKDILEMRKFIVQEISLLESNLSGVLEQISAQFGSGSNTNFA